MSVASKLRLVLQKTGVMTKDGKITGSGGNYGFLSEDKVTAVLHPIFAEVGLVVIPIKMEPISVREDRTANDKIMHNAVIQTTFLLIDPDDGDRLEGMALGEGSDIGDKMMNKCMTAAYKYFLLETCMISTGDDPDHHASQETTHSQRAPATRPAAAPAPASGHSDGTATMKDWFQAMEAAGLMEPDPERGDGKQKVSGKWYELCGKFNLPRAWSKYTPEEYGRAVMICRSYKAPQHDPIPEESGNLYPDANGITNPFDDQ